MAKGKKKRHSQDAATTFWACVLHGISDKSDSFEENIADFTLPFRFASPAEYFASLSRIILPEARASARESWWRSGYRAAPVRIASSNMVKPPAVARQRGVTESMWTLVLDVPKGQWDWPTMRTAWLVELWPSGVRQPALFFLEHSRYRWETGAGPSLHVCGFAPESWGWPDALSACVAEPGKVRPVDDMVPLLRMWTACFRHPKPPFFGQILGQPKSTHTVFSDSDDDNNTAPLLKSDTVLQSQDITQATVSSADSSPAAGLNELQRIAVDRVLSTAAFSHQCHLLQGPPGTGKTKTVVALLQALVRQGVSNSEQNQTMICAPSNGAVQVALESFLNTPEGYAAPVCLIGVDERIPDEGPLRSVFVHTRVQHASREVRCGAENACEMPRAAKALEALRICAPGVFKKLGFPHGYPVTTEAVKARFTRDSDNAVAAARRSTKPQREKLGKRNEVSSSTSSDSSSDSDNDEDESCGLLAKLEELATREKSGEAPEFEVDQLQAASLIFCTLSCSGRPGVQRALHGKVHTVLVDEAAQAIEAETLIPLCFAPRQMALIGDPMQLSATVCHSSAAKRALFCRSMMERMMCSGGEYCMLEVQYRMHPDICRFPSQRFYGGRLVNASNVLGSSEGHTLPPYAVMNVASGEENASIGSKWGEIKNEKEARMLVRFALWAAALGVGKVVVISFYSGQVALIRRLLRDAGVAGRNSAATVEVHTVDSFQGSEADIVMLSFVRANVNRKIGFLSEFRRLNVALTRAKHSLFIFANVDRLVEQDGKKQSDDIGALFADALSRGCVWPEEKAKTLMRSSRPVRAKRQRPAMMPDEPDAFRARITRTEPLLDSSIPCNGLQTNHYQEVLKTHETHSLRQNSSSLIFKRRSVLRHCSRKRASRCMLKLAMQRRQVKPFSAQRFTPWKKISKQRRIVRARVAL